MGCDPLYDMREPAGPSGTGASVTFEAPKTYQERHTVKCDNPYLHCEKLFATEKDMKHHKHNEPDHFFCKKCDRIDTKKREAAPNACPPKKPGQFDFEDWDAFTMHKVDAMAPFIEGRQKPTDDNPPAHIACEFCGEDFKSFGGRKRHRLHDHPADQDVECPGCKQHFVRAYLMIRHLEQNRCPNIRPLEFHRHISQKYIVSQVMHAPDKLLKSLAANKTVDDKNPGRIGQAHRDEDLDPLDQDEEGGVSLLDQADEAQMGGYKPLVPESDLIDVHNRGGPPSAALERWPRLPGQDLPDLSTSMRGMSIKTPRTPTRRDSILGREKTTVTASLPAKPIAWGSKTSEKLFPYSKEPKKQSKAADWSGILAQREAQAAAENNTSLWKSRWWDPTSPDYQVEIFYNAFEGAYLCPFESCEKDNHRFDSPYDLHVHMAHAHIRQVWGCVACHKRFPSPSSLVAHAESSRRCYVRDSGKFKQFITDITGGYLKAKEMPVPKIYHTDAVIKKGPQVQGVMETKFIGQNPDDN
ncbi:hypothetical protein CLAFUR0_03718 [Fulvia fulva]|nr:hypothetical protein CLAFUR0_03718 [Fulvia fulva]